MNTPLTTEISSQHTSHNKNIAVIKVKNKNSKHSKKNKVRIQNKDSVV
jgi:hypothetical protein